jgi:hypothetical protein
MKISKIAIILLIVFANTACVSSLDESNLQIVEKTPTVTKTTIPTIPLPTATVTLMPTRTPVAVTYDNLCNFNQKTVTISGYIYVGTGVSFLNLATKEYMILLSEDNSGTNPIS